MDKNTLKRWRKSNIFRYLCLIAYVVCAIVLIIESSLDGKTSAGQSNAVGGQIQNVVNEIGGDQTEAILPTNVKIDNKVSSAYVGDKFTLNLTTIPNNATYQSYTFESKNPNVASVSQDGTVNCKSAGTTTIIATNVKIKEVAASFNLEVKNVYATDLKVSLNAPFNEDDDAYHIDIDKKDYTIEAIIIPDNTTIKDVTYTQDIKTYLVVNETGNITPIQYSKNEITTISIQVNEIIKEIKVVVDMEIIPLTSLTSSITTDSIYPKQTKTPKVTITPTNATYKKYKLTTSNSKIVKISNLSYVGVDKGTATISIISTEYPSIVSKISVTVLAAPKVTSFSAYLSSKITIGTTNKISISNVKPQYADTSSLTYKSSNTKIATVTAQGQVKALALGDVTITITDKNNANLKKEIKTTVIEKANKTDTTTNFTVNYLKGSRPGIIVNQPIDLNDYFAIKSFETTNNVDPTDKTIKFSLVTTDNATLENTTLTATSLGEIQVKITHVASKISKIVSLIALDNFVIMENNQEVVSPISLEIGDAYTFGIYPETKALFDSVNNQHLSFYVTVDNESVATIESNENTTNEYTLQALASGQVEVSITPLYDEVVYESLTRTITFNINHIKVSNIDLIVYNKTENKEIIIQDNSLSMYINDVIYLYPAIDNKATISDIIFQSSDSKIATIDTNGKIMPKKAGIVKLSVLDKLSKISKSIDVTINNKILIDEKNTFTLKGYNSKYDAEADCYSITNGYSGSIKLNFAKASTYSKVSYSSSDDKILTVGQDGKITPNKAGEAIITMTCDDGIQEPIVIDVKIIVVRQNLIENSASFFYKVRKSIGHFGAFLVLGIFSTLTYLLFFKKKKWLFSVPLNFAAGFSLAALTELIQKYVPGRYGAWSDVMIDFVGFLFSAVTLTILILTIYLVRFIIKKIKMRNNKDVNIA